MRVVAGQLRGRSLHAPPGDATRPTSDRVREALFSMLGPLHDLRVLDLFAGSGALGIEALSRGARSATFVDDAPAAIVAVRLNIAELGIAPDRVEVRHSDAAAALRDAHACGASYDLVFLDPPYSQALSLSETLGGLLPAVLAVGARVVCESDRRTPGQLELAIVRERRYGDTLIRIHQS